MALHLSAIRKHCQLFPEKRLKTDENRLRVWDFRWLLKIDRSLGHLCTCDWSKSWTVVSLKTSCKYKQVVDASTKGIVGNQSRTIPRISKQMAGFEFFCSLLSSSSAVHGAALLLARSGIFKRTSIVPRLPVTAINTTDKVESLSALVCFGINLQHFLEAIVTMRQGKAA